MTATPNTYRYADQPWLGAWIVGGVILIVVNLISAQLVATTYRVEASFRFTPATPEQQARYDLVDALEKAPWLALGYAVVGLCVFCRRWIAFVFAAIFISCPFLSWLAAGLGRL